MKSLLKMIRAEIYYAAMLLRIGGLRVFLQQLKRQVYSRSVHIGLELNLEEIDIPPIEAKIAYTLRLATEEDMNDVLQRAKTESKEAARDLVTRRWLYEDGYHDCYISRTADTNDLAFMQSVIRSEDDKLVEGRFRSWFPKLTANEAILEGAYAFEKYRGKGLGSAVPAKILTIWKNKGVKRVITYIEKDNAAAFKAAERAGFKRFQEVRKLRIFFMERRSFNLIT